MSLNYARKVVILGNILREDECTNVNLEHEQCRDKRPVAYKGTVLFQSKFTFHFQHLGCNASHSLHKK